MVKVYRNGEYIGESPNLAGATAIIAKQRAFDAKYGPTWGFSLGQYDALDSSSDTFESDLDKIASAFIE